ncbi:MULTISPECIES: hypothetical protein [Streptomyces]|uniref:Secreted protein n=1 Tax=Streptomyces mordarskii TaxID=1226758 RepID=A0ABN1D481_9ACTN|nr:MULTISPECIES: hypothetical protein [Streptomyces]QTI90464.1 hypothetical protein AS97_60085 [Streptomyces sp. AgN23]RSS38610.1 hypothetical protein EF902_29775 [Streptomyces sp. WAC05858]WJD94673.1 hypothetical protein QR300_00750 [Streptomyces antimycoticus]WTA86605.1 hypothetical protein OG751_46065 [Streptomyces antimycoticus]
MAAQAVVILVFWTVQTHHAPSFLVSTQVPALAPLSCGVAQCCRVDTTATSAAGKVMWSISSEVRKPSA